MMFGAILTLLIFGPVQCGFINGMYDRVPVPKYSILSTSCEFYTATHQPVPATTCGQMCIIVDCFVFAVNSSRCAVCQYVGTADQNMPSWETFTAVYKKRKSISFIIGYCHVWASLEHLPVCLAGWVTG